MALSPKLHVVPAPATPLTPWNHSISHVDMSKDAEVYSQNQIQQWLDSLEFESFHSMMTTVLAATVCQYGDQHTCPNHPPPNYFAAFTPPALVHRVLNNYLGKFVKILADVGEVCSILVAMYLLVGLSRVVLGGSSEKGDSKVGFPEF